MSSMPAATSPSGSPVAQPIYLVDINGNPLSSSGSVAIQRAGNTVLTIASGSVSTNGNTNDLNVAPYTELAIDIDMTGSSGTGPTIQFIWSRKGTDGIYYPIYQSAVISAFPALLSTSLGPGLAYTQSLGQVGRLSWVLGGTSPSVTFSASLQGK
jgi:hypothetical protein